MDGFDRAIQTTVAVCDWLLTNTNYKEHIDRVVQLRNKTEYETELKKLIQLLKDQLEPATKGLQNAESKVGFPNQDTKASLKEPCRALAEVEKRLIHLHIQMAESEAEFKELQDTLKGLQDELKALPAGPQFQAVAQQKQADVQRKQDDLAKKTAIQATTKGEIEKNTVERSSKRDQAYQAIEKSFGLVKQEADLEGMMKECDKMRTSLKDNPGQASGLFSVLLDWERNLFQKELNAFEGRFQAIKKENEALAQGMIAAQRKAELKATEFRRKAAEVDLGMAETFREIAERKVSEQQHLLTQTECFLVVDCPWHNDKASTD